VNDTKYYLDVLTADIHSVICATVDAEGRPVTRTMSRGLSSGLYRSHVRSVQDRSAPLPALRQLFHRLSPRRGDPPLILYLGQYASLLQSEIGAMTPIFYAFKQKLRHRRKTDAGAANLKLFHCDEFVISRTQSDFFTVFEGFFPRDVRVAVEPDIAVIVKIW
jgi:hypothetical protein